MTASQAYPCMAVWLCMGCWIGSGLVIFTMSRLMRLYGMSTYIRSNQGAEFTGGTVMRWLRDPYVRPAFIGPDKPLQKGFVEGFNGKVRDECLS